MFSGQDSMLPNAGSLGSIPGQGTRSHMLQLRPGAAKELKIKGLAKLKKIVLLKTNQKIHASQLSVARTWRQPKSPFTGEWIKKMQYIYTMEYYSAIKKNEVMPFAATWMDLEIIILSEVSLTEKDKYHNITYM